MTADSFAGVVGPAVYEGEAVVIWACPRSECSYAVRSNEQHPGFQVWQHRCSCTKDNSDPRWLQRSPTPPSYSICSGCDVDAGPPWLSCWECGWVQICVQCQQRDHAGAGHRVVEPPPPNDNTLRRRRRKAPRSTASSSQPQVVKLFAAPGEGDSVVAALGEHVPVGMQLEVEEVAATHDKETGLPLSSVATGTGSSSHGKGSSSQV